MWNKIIGIGAFLLGLLMTIGFPSMSRYQPENMGRSGIIIGLVLIVVGLYLMKT